MKGQSSVEFLLIVAIFLTVVASTTLPQMINPSRDASDSVQSGAQARNACDRIADTINSIVSSGENSVDSIDVSISDNWKLEMQSSPPKLIIKVGEEGLTMKNDLKYGFEDSKSASRGSYIIIVQKGGVEGVENSGNKISINLNPSSGGGEWG